MKVIQIRWNFVFCKCRKILILSASWTYSNRSVSNQVLRKLVKHHNLVNVSSRELLYLQRAPFGVFFYVSILNWCNCHSCCDFSRLQMWLQPDRVSCLKTLRISYNTAFTTLHGSHHGVFFASLIFSRYRSCGIMR